MPRHFAESARGRVGRPRSPATLVRRIDALRLAFEAEGQRQHLPGWTDSDLAAVVAAIKALAAPFEIEQFGRWQRAADDEEEE